ncbi:hypothetical protein GLAREA_06128 [Glarea lozoyensis ATCC 20868]|uniref:2EXR domain-containing protein n=1 Tax=Glarea lozoyensis (strain ATCC 20868 / MF5171) TaxID=1116229 RepID=S3DM19_GLAL2|nr:uncharacterized protein GLAREA_06128 [Glarea lozoyensis ATCC 20868]EPE33116.1 hypothetical protein GLAREA_06128 [Glarea lozoyensis ATCC 20868]
MVQTRSASARAAILGSPPRCVPPKMRKPPKSKNKKVATKQKDPSSPLTSFHLFEKLPLELRAMVWQMTLVPRTVEVNYVPVRGFYSRTITPIALRACPDSRSAVIYAYQMCFGNFIHSPRTPFNFSIDTIYLDNNVENDVTLILTCLKPQEAARIQRIAISEYVDMNWATCIRSEDNTFDLIRQVVPLLPALRSIQLVNDLSLRVEEMNYHEGAGAVKLYDSWPAGLLEDHLRMMNTGGSMCACGHCFDDYTAEEIYEEIGDCPCGDHELEDPTLPDLLGGIEGVKVTSIWGWRPSEPYRLSQF